MIKKTDKILVTGCGGMLGEAVFSTFKDVSNLHATDIDLNESWLSMLDVSKPKSLTEYLTAYKPKYIIHLAALTDMEYCELNEKETRAVNARSVKTLAAYSRKHDVPLLYISTAGVFDGKQDEYTESDMPNPLSVYAKTKYEGELEAKKAAKWIIIRAGWMMGGGPKKDKKFINKIIKQIQAGAKELFVVHDKIGTPCYTYDLAQSMKFLLDNEQYGKIYHGACDGGGSRADVARFLLKELGLAKKVKVTEVDSSYFKKDFFAPRPYSEQLVNIELKKLAPHLTRDWKVCVSEYVEKFDWNV